MITQQAEITAEELRQLSQRLEGHAPQEVLSWALQRFGQDIALACSFGGLSGMALLDMAVKIDPAVDVYYLDTDFLFQETRELVDRARSVYGIRPRAIRSRWTPAEQATQFGDALWARDPDLCCHLRKVEPNQRALEGKRAWISGLRRDQSRARRSIGVVEWDDTLGLVKVNPLANWTEAQVWSYVREHDVPYNELHDRGYPSIGCTHCTRAVAPDEDSRAGRWTGFVKTECGLHGLPVAETPAADG